MEGYSNYNSISVQVESDTLPFVVDIQRSTVVVLYNILYINILFGKQKRGEDYNNYLMDSEMLGSINPDRTLFSNRADSSFSSQNPSETDPTKESLRGRPLLSLYTRSFGLQRRGREWSINLPAWQLVAKLLAASSVLNSIKAKL